MLQDHLANINPHDTKTKVWYKNLLAMYGKQNFDSPPQMPEETERGEKYPFGPEDLPVEDMENLYCHLCHTKLATVRLENGEWNLGSRQIVLIKVNGTPAFIGRNCYQKIAIFCNLGRVGPITSKEKAALRKQTSEKLGGEKPAQTLLEWVLNHKEVPADIKQIAVDIKIDGFAQEADIKRLLGYYKATRKWSIKTMCAGSLAADIEELEKYHGHLPGWLTVIEWYGLVLSCKLSCRLKTPNN